MATPRRRCSTLVLYWSRSVIISAATMLSWSKAGWRAVVNAAVSLETNYPIKIQRFNLIYA